MMGTINCIYETPCGWCSKWDKKCDKKIPERGQRTKCNPVDDAMDDTTKEYVESALANAVCKPEDHKWVCCEVSTEGIDCRCKKCGAHVTVPCSGSMLGLYHIE